MANNKNRKRSGSSKDAKKDEVAENGFKYMAVGMVLVIVAIALIALLLLGGDGHQAYNQANVNDDGDVLIPLDQIGTSASYYQENVDGVTIKYFTVKGSDGKIHAAFDACDVCYHSKQGYVQRGDEMVCGNCGLTYPINGIGTENIGGGCWPGYLQTSSQDGNLVIQKTSLARGKYYFE